MSGINSEKKIRYKDAKSISVNLFESILTSFSQGAGFGSLVSLMDIIVSEAKKEGDDYLINGELFGVVKNNIALAQKAMDTFSEIAKISAVEYTPERISIAQLHDAIFKKMKELENKAAIKK